MARPSANARIAAPLLRFRALAILAIVAVVMSAGTAPSATAQQTSGSGSPIDHIIVIYLENRSFDSLYGTFPGADGIAQAGTAATQVDDNGNPYDTLPAVDGPPLDRSLPWTQLPSLPNGPFDLSPFAPMEQPINTAFEGVNNFYREQIAIDGGNMDRFVTQSGSLTMGYYDGQSLPMWPYAQRYTLADHFFHAAFGPTGPNHFWLICACEPVWPDAPPEIVAEVAPDGTLIKDGLVSPDGYAVNNIGREYVSRLPRQTMPHIGDRLDDAGVSWAWYTGGWASGAITPVYPAFQFFADTAVGTPGAELHLKDETDFLDALQGGTLPSVAFVKPRPDNENPSNNDGLLPDDQHTADLVRAVEESPYWSSSAIIVTYDEAGGSWDHVAPTVVDRWGPGRRVPTIIISPHAKHSFVDHTIYDTTSILRFIEWRWNLPPLGTRDAAANNLLNAFDFAQ